MIIEEILKKAKPVLKEKRVKKVVIGLELMAVELDDGSLGLSYVLTDRLQGQCKSLSESGQLGGLPAQDLADWALNRENDIKSGLGIAVLSAVAHHFYTEENLQQVDAGNAFSLDKNDVVGFIGYIAPIVKQVRPRVNRVIIFDKGKENFTKEVCPSYQQKELLPLCDVIFISGSTLINHTIDSLMAYCQSARQTIITGLSTCLYPMAFKNTPVTHLAGMYWKPENKEKIFNKVGQAAGMIHLVHLGKKLTIELKNNIKKVEVK